MALRRQQKAPDEVYYDELYELLVEAVTKLYVMPADARGRLKEVLVREVLPKCR